MLNRKLIFAGKVIGLAALVVMSSLYLFHTFESSGEELGKEEERNQHDTAVGDTDNHNDGENAEVGDETVVYETIEFTDGRVYLGDEDAANEVILVIDYMCPFCKEWIDDVFPLLKADYIEEGDVKFYVLPQVYLSKETLALTEFTQKVEMIYPEQYFKVLDRIFADHGLDDWGSDAYLDHVAEEMELSGWEEVDLEYDVIRRTRQVTRGLAVDVVPTVYVNGRMVEDRMDYAEIVSLIQETKNPLQFVPSDEVCGQDADDC